MTLVETLVVIGILSIIAALAFPAYLGSKAAAKVTSSLNNLRQLHGVVMLYQVDNGGGGVYGAASDMGLPTGRALWPTLQLYKVPTETYTSPCGWNNYRPNSPRPRVAYTYWPSDDEQAATRLRQFQENAVVFSDENCNPDPTDMGDRAIAKRGLAVFMSGRAVVRRKKGDMWSNEWWTSN